MESKENNILRLNRVADSFVQFFNNREFNNLELISQIFNNPESDQWWMSGDENMYPFSGWKPIQKRLNDMIPLIHGYDQFSFTESNKTFNIEKNLIIMEARTSAVGYGDNIYINEYAFFLTVNNDGKICLIKEYFDPSEILKYSLSNKKLTELYHKV
ncbi:hypothetical protein DDB_G0287093 [Dictyostelium discoideum AX4]|uniref:UPF0523 protein C n=1 Tax=Dictyostelium discoideum TaxID=44689 RepID=U523C_DICDI|nr:hypothetical protein DDB_G0287093 [Dictyostelium discoideum AX4]Q54KU7.1 RecName: Full=UPF0523 protein C [Dictyostelium discoideum]EAL63911.1 hypothetical protein DDB_G0287093 [Dictyostelium discoideum AX4]|eukprot:XP_637423.1 hypothetical protein DDB_G0287093 [Dictyostelium discoideum AX4]